ncbi:MAG: ZIP family metal transporter [Flavobacteriales bacterium]
MVYVILIFAVLLGVLLARFFKNNNKITDWLLMFSGAYLLCATFLHNLPLLYQKADESVWVFVVVGIIIQMILESFSKGVEHGHVHHNQKISASIVFGLMIHAFLEGMPLGEAHDHKNMIAAIAIHKIPVATILYFYLTSVFHTMKKAYVVMLLFAFMTPLGTLISQYTVLNQYSYYILALVSGVFIHISTTILFENSSKAHRLSWQKLIMLLISTFLVLMI